MSETAVVFVHGFLSSADTWAAFVRLAAQDDDLTGLHVHTFGYESPLVSLNPLRRIPHIDDIADDLRTYLSQDLADHSRLALVSHSQGGLVVQRALARMLADNPGELDRLRLVLMYACPNAGSDLALPLRRTFLRRHPQEADLRPLRATVLDAQRVVLRQIVHAPQPTIRVKVYAGASDGVVPPASARSVFPDAGVLPGDHFSIIQPDSLEHRSYVVLRRALLALDDPALPADATADAPAATTSLSPPAPVTPPPATVSSAGGQTVAGRPAKPEQAAGPKAEPTGDEYAELVRLLLDLPHIHDPSFRQQLYTLLPGPVQEQLPRSPVARLELIGMLSMLWRYRHLDSWRALGAGLEALVPDHPATVTLLARLDALARP
ncbi:esterase/lipase family protein [Micromonospora craniellae]|uniref:Alpha/beta fold hydrolase n=1 Tax=Micromonospora craniellae TaxID=2294034 RepID=A0A372FXI4_9ACTN|nr:alpha/beta fold hydrolase [Micromonospora craniellae]QOC93330.1 alpha/beta fold hydrolase [Micromonospora craniellae]RFS45334.1 alpha/beta fold hydrolase [Micromonospora craniellae]